jgi:nickel/cobalt exporter
LNPIIENPFTWLYFPTALMLGALHALEPGHAKTLTAAYLIGIKGTKRDALFLGLAVAFTHSIVVIGISVLALWLGRETFTQDVTHWLQIGSGAIVVVLGTWMFIKRWRLMKKVKAHHGHHGAPEPIHIKTSETEGILEIVNTRGGERMKYTASRSSDGLSFRVLILRADGPEMLPLERDPVEPGSYVSSVAPNEPHEFTAEFEISKGSKADVVAFEMHEPAHAHEHSHHDHGAHGHSDHDHSHMDDDEHARAHAATIPEYAKRGERPTVGQILAFGAAGGMIPCPASITVMLLALSIGKFASGLLAVAGFSLGLAITLVGLGLIVVAGISRFRSSSGKLHWLSTQAPLISAGVVILSGLAALLFAH